MQSLSELLDVWPRRGVVEWIGLRPAKRAAMLSVAHVLASVDGGLAGDRYASSRGKRQVTLIQAEHLDVVASLLGTARVAPDVLRRNLVVRGINLLALKNKPFHVGNAVLEFTGLCHPCSRMEVALGPGGYNALRGHGGITARVVTNGEIRLQDAVSPA